EPDGYRLSQAKPAPVLGPYKTEIEDLLQTNEALPPKQRYTSKKIFQTIQKNGYAGRESTVRHYVGQVRKSRKRPAIYLPLAFDPGQDAQVDWGEAVVVMGGEKVKVQLFLMRLCYSRKRFVMAFPTQRQEAFFLGHVQAFAHFGGVPHRISYDNLKTAVKRILEGRNREEQTQFTRLRSHYVFESRFCTPGQGHEKGGIESDVGGARRDFLVPPPEVADFGELNALLNAACAADDQRHVERATDSIGVMWQSERLSLRPLPAHTFACYTSREATLNGYGQVQFETNRYSVPAAKARKRLTLRAYPFHLEIVADNEIIARHERCYGRHQDILDPLHYLPLLEQRPGAFEHAQPLRQWRNHWPPVYEEMLAALRRREESESRAVRSFVQILNLHQNHAGEQVETAVSQALAEGLTSPEGVRFCLNRLLDPTPEMSLLDLSAQPDLASLGHQPLGLDRYNCFLPQVCP
ncbi:MAG: IS21 family transposase, partial [Dehalococcoidia bacterium]|nr:IS21 family transposase [Dehalococcoidia bacterium]